VVVVNEDTLDFDGHNFKQTSGTFVDSALLSSAYFLRDLYSNQQKEFTVLGGGKFGDAMKWVGRNALKLAKNAWDNREKIASTVGDVANLMKAVRVVLSLSTTSLEVLNAVLPLLALVRSKSRSSSKSDCFELCFKTRFKKIKKLKN
jgi:hypothetical protein